MAWDAGGTDGTEQIANKRRSNRVMSCSFTRLRQRNVELLDRVAKCSAAIIYSDSLMQVDGPNGIKCNNRSGGHRGALGHL